MKKSLPAVRLKVGTTFFSYQPVFFGSAIRAQLGIMQANYFARAHQAMIGQSTMALEPTG